ncbi:general secretion pathway protein C [Cystobacter fuscus DSM 2262]|uniref:General secretion pathway protein C n=1 Tax=Cystobacter fuscus (strain ATCC 25194 / DSM 2262 / NBRC 100088 / M29) TaxID=1242864 RepID=S9PMM5_CYSF2|nr:type II secretion system protein GspC [Cystobacter fuscus]EPX63697.1 general secretion pathway protein C [Cystobacter fuscus DSM 2262]
MNLLLRRAFPALCLLCVACACLMLASALNSVVDAWLQPPPPDPDAVVRKVSPRREEIPTPLALVPLRRYLGLPEKLRREVIPSHPESVPTRTDLRLLGTMRGASSLHTFASVLETPTQRTRSLWLGGEWQGARVIAIDRTRVLLSRDGRFEAIESRSAIALDAPAAPAPLAPSSSIRQVSPGNYKISRQEVADTLANLNQVAMQARVVPAFQDGVAKGFKLFSIRPDSLYTRLGLRNGDVLRRINGLSLTSMEHALEAFTRLRDAPRIELEVERDGQVQHQTYTVEG